MKDSALDGLIEQMNDLPSHRLLGIKLRHYGRGVASASLAIREELHGTDGFLTEGVLVSLGSAASRLAAATLCGPQRPIHWLEQRLSLLHPAQQGRLVAKAQVEYLRARLVHCIFKIQDKDGETVASGSFIGEVLRDPRSSTREKNGDEFNDRTEQLPTFESERDHTLEYEIGSDTPPKKGGS